MKNLFILGAGASRSAGGPLMADFLDIADNLVRTKDEAIQDAKKEFDDVFHAISELWTVYAKSYLDVDNIEILFGAIEMGILLERFSGRSLEDVQVLRESLITLIYKTLESSILYQFGGTQIQPTRGYSNFAKMLRELGGDTTDYSNTSVITFNYDVALDYALHFNGVQFDYCLGPEPNGSRLSLMKLHGSINWGTCNSCGSVVLVRFEDIGQRSLFEPGLVRWDLGSRLSEFPHCDQTLSSTPLIVPPTWDKNKYHTHLAAVWKTVANKLASAENIFVIGYSLPETDLFFRFLYALGSDSQTRIQRFWVINPDVKADPRFRSLIGRGIDGRYLFWPTEFDDALRSSRLMNAAQGK